MVVATHLAGYGDLTLGSENIKMSRVGKDSGIRARHKGATFRRSEMKDCEEGGGDGEGVMCGWMVGWIDG